MDITISGRNIDVGEDVYGYVESRVDRLNRYMDSIGEVRVELTEMSKAADGSRFVAQMTLHGARGQIMRAEERNASLEAAIDAATDKLSRQISRYKGKRKSKRRGKGMSLSVDEQLADYEAELESEFPDEQEMTVVRRKRFAIISMNEDEAIEQLELLDHDFFVYYNPDTAHVNVAYRRKGGGYGILEPEIG